MAAKKKVYWLGEMAGKRRVGRIKVDGVNVSIGESFDPGKLDKDRLSVFRKAGCVGDAPFLVSDQVSDDNTMLQGRIKDLGEAAKADGDKIAGLELDLEAAGDTTELKKRIVELEGEVKKLTEEAKEAADLKAIHVKAHADDKTEKKDGKK